MRQFIGKVRDDTSVRDLLVSVAPEPIRRAAAAVETAELRDDGARRRAGPDGLRPGAGRLGRRRRLRARDALGRLHGGRPRHRRSSRPSGATVRTLSGGEQKRLVLEALLRGPEEVLLLDEPDNYLDVPTKRWLEEALIASPKTVLFVSHDRELLDRVATRIATLEPTAAGSTLWVHPGRLRHLRPGPGRPERPPGGAAPALGRGARQAQGARRDVPAEGVVQLRHGPPSCRRRRPGCEGSRRPARREVLPLRAERADAAARRPHRQAGRHLRGARADRADAAVRPRGLVRRAGRDPRQQRLGQVATSCG